MRKASLDPAMLATDLADYLVKKGMPFRRAHHVSGEVVALAEVTRGDDCSTCHPTTCAHISDLFGDDVSDVLDFDRVIHVHAARRAGQPLNAVRQQIIANARKRLSDRL
jgi:argininosuccinate lyase